MRRKDREVTDRKAIQAIIRSCHCCRLGFYEDGAVYIVPLNFGYEEIGGKDRFYFHSAPEGRKIDCIRRGGSVGFELDAGYQLHPADVPCGYSAAFQSVIGTGRVSMIEDPDQKRHALRCIMEHLTGRSDWDFPEGAVNGVAVFQLEADEVSCKEHL